MLAFFINFLITVFVIDSGLIVLIVLMQRPKSEGLGAAFGGGMTENLFGAQTTNVLANFTRWLGGLFFGIALLLSILYARQSTQRSLIQQEALRHASPIPAASPAATHAASPAATHPAATPAVSLRNSTEPALPAASPAPFSSPASLFAPPPPAAEVTPVPFLPAPSLNGSGASGR